MLTCIAIILFNDKERKIAEDVVHRMVKRAVEMEGTVTGEHGVGLVKRDYLEHELGQSTVDLMRKVSQKSTGLVSIFLANLTDHTAQASLRSTLPPELRQGGSLTTAKARRSPALVACCSCLVASYRKCPPCFS